jgi:membrane-associated protein
MPHLFGVVAGSPWLLVVVLLVAGLDALLPFMPSESTVVAAAVLSAHSGRPHVVALVAAASAGAYLGDLAAFSFGRRSTARVVARLERGPRSKAVHGWVRGLLLHRRGHVVIMFARYVPGGRSTAAFAAGVCGYPPARFRLFTAIGVVIWSIQAVAFGYLGGTVFEGHPFLGMLLGWACAAVLTGVAMLIPRGRQDHKSIRDGSVSQTDPLR